MLLVDEATCIKIQFQKRVISGAGGAEESKCNDPELLKLDQVHHADWFESRNLPGWDS